MATPPKYRVTLFKSKWWQVWYYRKHQIAIEKYDGRTRTYKPMATKDIQVRDISGYND